MPNPGIGTNQDFEFESFWWKPGGAGDEEQTAAQGRLSYAPTDGVTLSIIDLHGDLLPPLRDSPDDIPALHGHSLGGKPCTLLDLTFSNSQSVFGAHTHEEWHSNRLIYGAHVEKADELQFKRARLKVSGLREWLWGRWPDSDNPFVRGGEGILEIDLPGARMTLQREERSKNTLFESWEKFDASARFDFELPTTLSEFKERYVTPLHDLVLLGMHEEIRIENLTILVLEDLEKWWGDKEPIRHWDEIEVVERTNSQPLRPKKNRYENWLIPLMAWGDHAPERVRDWFELRRRLAGLGDLLFATLNVRYIYLENQVLNLLAFAEGYHREIHDELLVPQDEHEENVEKMLAALESKKSRDLYRQRLRFANEQSQRRRLRELFKRAGQVVDSARVWWDDQEDALIDTRNYLTHWGEKTENVVEGPELYKVLKCLQAVIEINLLLDIGTEEETLEAAINGYYQGRGILERETADRMPG